MKLGAPLLLLALVGCSAAGADAGEGGAGGSGFGPLGGNEGQGGGGGIDVCVSKTVVGEEIPLEMVVVQDRSGSMEGDKWSEAVVALQAFADSPGAEGISAGLAYFPAPVGDGCEDEAYASLSVPLGELPAHAAAIKASLSTTQPFGGTPMRPALEGAIANLSTSLSEGPVREGVIVLVTDGDPTGCTDNTAHHVEALAAEALEGPPSIRTFVVGMEGASFDNLDDIAEAGGTGDAVDVVGGAADFLAALEDIRRQALACEYQLPTPDPAEGILDSQSVEVQFVPGLNEAPVAIHRVDDASGCGELSGGFYFDDPLTPTRIVLCAASCEDVRAGTIHARIEVILGCILPPAS